MRGRSVDLLEVVTTVALVLLALATLLLLPACGLFPPKPPPEPTPPPLECPPSCPEGQECLDPAVGCQPRPDDLPPKDVLIAEDMILRTDYTKLVTVTGKPVSLNQNIPCCAPLIPAERKVRRPTPLKVNGAEINLLWPMMSEAGQDYFRERGRANGFHFRMGPFHTDVDAEVDWVAIGGPYLTGPAGEWTPEWNPAHWKRVRQLAYHALKHNNWVEIVPIDHWGCKVSQRGDHYLLWPQDAIDQCGRTWHPEHERYVRKVVEELGCMGNVFYALDNEFGGIVGHKTEWLQKMLNVLHQAERVNCRPRITGTSMLTGVGADYLITHDREPLTAPLRPDTWSSNNERNPAHPPAVDTSYFVQARNRNLGWALWRNGWTDAQLEDALARRKAVVDGGQQPSACPKPLAPGASVYLNDQSYGHGFDSTVRVKGDAEFCRLIHGTVTDDCHLEGWPQRSACEMELLSKHGGSCPIWQCRTSSHLDPLRCLQPAHPVCSCDHWGTAGGAQDDPHTPEYEGQPAECGAQRVEGLPAAGFYTVARGKGDVRACLPDGTGCGPWRFFDKAVP